MGEFWSPGGPPEAEDAQIHHPGEDGLAQLLVNDLAQHVLRREDDLWPRGQG
jgi:hypothetical protein